MNIMKKRERLVALDVLRGMTVLFMIIVNMPGTEAHVWPPLRHSPWHGCRPADLVFPYFLYIVGVAMWFSFRRYGHRLTGGAAWRILRRVAGIFAIGLFIQAMAGGFDMGHLRYMGVLQRIALAYGLASLIVLVVPRTARWGVAAFILLGYWAVLYFFGGEDPYDLMTNVVRRIDLAVLGADHLWHNFPLNAAAKVAFEPEGLLSTLPSAVTVIIGYQMGEMIGTSSDHHRTSVRLLLYGLVGIGLGLLWDPWFPINKPLWTSSYVLFTAGWASLWLGVMLWLIDVKGWKGWTTPFVAVGMNPLFLYVLSELWIIFLFKIQVQGMCLYTWIYRHLFVPWSGDNDLGSFLFALSQALLMALIGWGMYKKRIFIKI